MKKRKIKRRSPLDPRKRKQRLIPKSTVNKFEREARRKMKVINDVRNLERQGYRLIKGSFNNPTTSKLIMENRIKKAMGKKYNKKLIPTLKKIHIKKVQHPQKDIKIYIPVIKK